MKNIFEVDSNEIKRILSLHEESTKKQYLNLINEIGAAGEGEIDYSDTVQNSNMEKFYNAVMKSKEVGNALQSYTVSSNAYQLENHSGSGAAELEIYRGTKFVKKKSNSNKDYLESQNVSIAFKNDFIETGEGTKTKGSVIYWCTGNIAGKFQVIIPDTPELSYYKKYMWFDETGDLAPMLARVCKYIPELKKQAKLTPDQQLQRAKKMGWKDWESYKNSGWKSNTTKTNNSKQSVNTQTFATQNTELTKQVQTSLGNTTPTGQITDTDLDQIITQLNK